jgi:hypothetical protein
MTIFLKPSLTLLATALGLVLADCSTEDSGSDSLAHKSKNT